MTNEYIPIRRKRTKHHDESMPTLSAREQLVVLAVAFVRAARVVARYLPVHVRRRRDSN